MQLPEPRLKEMETRFEEIERAMSDPATAVQRDKLRDLGREHAELKPTVEAWRAFKAAADDIEQAKEMLAGSQGEERAYLQDEIRTQEQTVQRLAEQIAEALLPRDPNDDKDVIVEVRPAAGGDEAGLFAGDLLRMYTRYAESKGWKTEILSSNPTGVGGYKDVVFAVKGKGAYSRLKFEAGVHRVQRVPVTESGGRIHTSTVAVNILPEAEDIEIEIDPNDLRIDVYRSSGPGGQSVNTTDSAVRIKHLPTGIEVACQDEKSQLQNKAKAMRILRARLLQMREEEQRKQIAEERRSQVRTGDRSERIRTYNFQESRVSDHRIGFTVHRLNEILQGDLDELIDALGHSVRKDTLGDGGGEL